MSGHSHSHNIAIKKAANDAKKSKIFSKMSRLITVAARQGGGDPEANPSLRLAIQRAKDASMPKDNIEKAIKKGTGELGGDSIEEIMYEAYGPDGGALMIYCLTDNANRTVSEIRSLLNKYNGNLGTKGSTSYIFNSENKEPMFYIDVKGPEAIQKIDNFVDAFEDMDDVQEIFHNYKFIEE